MRFDLCVLIMTWLALLLSSEDNISGVLRRLSDHQNIPSGPNVGGRGGGAGEEVWRSSEVDKQDPYMHTGGNGDRADWSDVGLAGRICRITRIAKVISVALANQRRNKSNRAYMMLADNDDPMKMIDAQQYSVFRLRHWLDEIRGLRDRYHFSYFWFCFLIAVISGVTTLLGKLPMS